MAGRPIEFELRLERADAATRDLQGFNRTLGESGTAAQRSGSALNDWKSILGGATVVAGGLSAAVVTGAQAFRAFAEEADRQAAIMQRFSGDIRPAREAMSGLVGELQLMETHSRLAAAGINLNGRDLRNVMVAAFEHAERTGEDFNATLDRLGQAVIRGGRGLRQFGIDAETPQEALEELNEQFGDVEVSADSVADRMQQLDVVMEDATSAFMEQITATGELETAFNNLFASLTTGGMTVETFFMNLRDSGAFYGAVVAEIIERLGAQLAANMGGLREFAEAARALTQGEWGAAVEHLRSAGASFRPGAGLETQGSFMGDVEGRIDAGRTRSRERNAGGDETTITVPQRPRGGRRAADPWSEEEIDARMEREAEFVNDLGNLNDEYYSDLRQQREDDAEHQQQIFEENRRYWLELSDERKEKAREESELQIELLEKQKQGIREESEEIRDHAMGVLQPAVSGLVDALSAVLAGTKSADEAFMGMLSSFLEMISQQAALEAAKEFASAIASFASQDYPGGAMHIAAGVAWTGVAIAAGAGAVATAPAAQSAPASPERGAGNSGSGDRTVVVNVNGPMMNAGGRAELGRDIRSLVEEGDRYYGSAA
jgi:hypothetical protein